MSIYNIHFIQNKQVGMFAIWDVLLKLILTLQWRHNGHDGVANPELYDCSGADEKKTSKLRVFGLCAGNSHVSGEFSAQMASDAEMFPFDDVIMSSYIANHVCSWLIS